MSLKTDRDNAAPHNAHTLMRSAVNTQTREIFSVSAAAAALDLFTVFLCKSQTCTEVFSAEY